MGNPAIVVVALLLGATAFGVLCLAFRFRMSDLPYFAAVLLPNIWLSRLDVNSLRPYNLKLPTSWAVYVVLAIVMLPAGRAATRALTRRTGRRLWGTVAALLVVFALSTLTNAGSIEGIARGVQATCYFLLPFAAAWSIVQCQQVDERGVSRAMTALMIVGGGTALLALASAIAPGLFAGIVETKRVYQEEGRSFSPIGGPSAVAMCLLLVYCVAAGQIMAKRQRILSAAVLGLCFMAVLTTLSRSAAAVFVVANVYLYGRYYKGMAKRGAILLITGAVLLLPTGYWLSKNYSLERLLTGWSVRGRGQETASTRARFGALESAVRYGTRHLPFGGGWGQVYKPPREHGGKRQLEHKVRLDGELSVSKPHNLYMLLYTEGGIFALGLFLIFFWILWRETRPPDVNVCPGGHAIVHGFRSGLLSFIVFSFVQDHLFFASGVSFFFLLFALMGMLASLYYRGIVAQQAQVVHVVSAVQPEGSAPGAQYTGAAR